MGIHRHASRDLFRGSTIDRVLRHYPIPVLVVKRPADQAYDRVLVAADFSLPSRRAASMALKLKGPEDLRVVHAYVHLLSWLPGATEEERVSRLEQMLADELPELAGQAQFIAKEGETVGVVYDEANSWPADLLVFGTHGRTGIRLAMLGSVAEQFLAEPPCDLLAVRT